MAGRQRVPPREARALRQRLATYVEGRYGSWPAFERAMGVPHATADRWRRGLAVPELPQLLKMAAQDRVLDLHHLLTGRRPPRLLGVPELEGMLLNLAAATVRWAKKQPRARGRKATHKRRKA